MTVLGSLIGAALGSAAGSAAWAAAGRPATDLAPSEIGPGLGGFLTMFGLSVATILLVRSMVGHLRKVRYSPDPSAEPLAPPTAQPTPPAQPTDDGRSAG